MHCMSSTMSHRDVSTNQNLTAGNRLGETRPIRSKRTEAKEKPSVQGVHG